MGFTVPAALGAKLARPEIPVVGVLGDGDLLMTIQELATAAQYEIAVLYCVGNNAGYLSIRDMQVRLFGVESVIGTESKRASGRWYTPDLAGVARAFGVFAETVTEREALRPALERALATQGPAVVEVMTSRDYPESGNMLPGWAEFPLPYSGESIA